MKILVLAVPVGAGHMKAAGAIKQAIDSLADKAITRLEDCFKWIWPIYGYSYKNIYEFGQKHSSAILKFWYRGTGIRGSDRKFYLFHKMTAHRFKNLLDEFRPDYILSTHFSPAYYAATFKNEYSYQLGVVVTDYYIHPHWVNNEVDHYFIPHESLIGQIAGHGAKKEKIYPLGIPVNPASEHKVDKVAARKRFNLSENRISAVVMGSRVFGGEWFEIVREIVDFDYDLSVLCGENKQAIEQIKKLKGRANLKIYGMVEGILDLIGTCDILITKAGGITTTEASQIGPCLLLANSIVGLEDKNEDFFVSHNAALKIKKDNAKQIMSDLLANPAKMQEMRKNLKKIGRQDSALNIAKVILGSHPYDTRKI